MCGRFTQTHTAEAIAATFQVPTVPPAPPRYNIAPSQLIGTIWHPQGAAGRQFMPLQWGLVPFWAKDPAIGNRLINARAETVTEKPSFRAAFRYRRCLIVADGFYEWQRQARKKQPYYFRFQGRSLFAFAGLWEQWESPAGEVLQTCTILTTTANAVLQPIHDRMPVILPPEAYDAWLDPTLNDAKELQPWLQPYPAAEMVAEPVSPLVNRATVDQAECIQPIALEPATL